MQEFLGKRAFVTGAAMGIGKEIALQLAKRGCHLWLVDIDSKQLHDVAQSAQHLGVEVVARHCDLANADDVEHVVEEVYNEWNDLDLLVNNAGVCFYGDTQSMSDQQWEKSIAVNLYSPIQLTRRFLPLLLPKMDAHVLNVCSMYAFIATNRCSAYHAAKFGLLGFTEALRAEYGRTGLGVTALCPGFVDTEFFNNMMEGNKAARRPPRWLTTTPQKVAIKAIRSIERDKRMVPVSALAVVAHWARRLVPGLLDSLYRIGRRKKLRAKRQAIGLIDDSENGSVLDFHISPDPYLSSTCDSNQTSNSSRAA